MSRHHFDPTDDTIVALSTPSGSGAIAVIRISGEQAIAIVNQVFKGKNLEEQAGYTLHFGTIEKDGKVLDEVLISLFKGPRSFTKEDVIEISCHGSPYIVRSIMELLIEKGARAAKAGEFTRRAYLNGRFDLTQAEAIADLIAAETEAAHRAAMHQMRGGFSEKISALRQQLVHFASLIELELDFVEEDVEFADRDKLVSLIDEIMRVTSALIESFQLGNVIKNGIPTVIAGKPNAGKSTLLNALLNEEKAIVSDIPGTTRDFIEDELIIEGIAFRFVDTAGLRETTDKVEAIGVERTKEKMRKASLILYIFDAATDTISDVKREINLMENLGIPFLTLVNKIDQCEETTLAPFMKLPGAIPISADKKENLELLRERLIETVNLDQFKTGDTVVTNQRHLESLKKTQEDLQRVLDGIYQQVTHDFLAMDIRQALFHLGEITGEISNDDLLSNIFSKFCIGK
ncbi:MAG: tRNA uridine-5-carboxymethylaminomethyl(34) synthesis GTPase MnmE [Cyclobacteriaceae bacterium]|nr:tRNA uridine-5-carboxymethylaminomethyl(34) synthesis GTPase MnmE [Cyclobacteriaceae bacterium]MCH8517760.1 tRNA uridine-5-carboxymethylaminomethyl(34) synthesis GTPase MnmE [Cyclobacteriaceae bacterium]